MGKKIRPLAAADHTGSCSCGCIFMESTDRIALGDRAGRSLRLYRTGGGKALPWKRRKHRRRPGRRAM